MEITNFIVVRGVKKINLNCKSKEDPEGDFTEDLCVIKDFLYFVKSV